MKKPFLLLPVLLLCLNCGCSLRDAGPVPSPAAAAESAASQALSVAEQYRDVYEDIFSGSGAGLYLSQGESEKILDRFASLGYAAFDASGSFPVTAPALVEDFFAARDAGQDAALSLYEICSDGGFLCHRLCVTEGVCSVIRVRLTWSDGGPYRMQGTTPVIGYAGKYPVLNLSFSEGVLCYEYDLPENPPGTSHDGHVDTLVRLPLH